MSYVYIAEAFADLAGPQLPHHHVIPFNGLTL